MHLITAWKAWWGPPGLLLTPKAPAASVEAKDGATQAVGDPLSYVGATDVLCPDAHKAHRGCYNRANEALYKYRVAKSTELHASTGGRETRAGAVVAESFKVESRGSRNGAAELSLTKEAATFVGTLLGSKRRQPGKCWVKFKFLTLDGYLSALGRPPV